MNFEQKLSKLLDHPSVDSDTGMVLEDEGYDAAKKNKLVPDNWYTLYVRYVGKLNALPHEELKMHEIINPTTGQVFPMPSWPTKQTRTHSSATWDAYNKKIQTDDNPELEFNPCANPDTFIQTTMQQCVKAGQQVGRLHPQAVQRKCEKQISKLKSAVDDYCNVDGGDEFIQNLLKQMDFEGNE